MNLHEIARRMAVVANVLITISLFLTVISWHISLALFVACWILYGLAWILEGGAVKRELSATASR